MKDQPSTGPTPQSAEEAEAEESVTRASKLPSKLIYEVIRRDGEEELMRTNRSLFFSGIAAGLMMAFSVVGGSVTTHVT